MRVGSYKLSNGRCGALSTSRRCPLPRRLTVPFIAKGGGQLLQGNYE
jgi:hypothetical protein